MHAYLLICQALLVACDDSWLYIVITSDGLRIYVFFTWSKKKDRVSYFLLSRKDLLIPCDLLLDGAAS